VRAFNSPALRRLIAYVRREEVDTIYSNTSITILGADLARRTHIRHVWHWHEVADATFGFHPSLRPLYRRTTKKAHVLFISRQQKQGWEVTLGRPLNGTVLYNPIKQIIPMKSEVSAPHNGVRIGFIGHFEARKNIPLLVHTFERLHAHTPNTSLWLCGARGAADIRFVEQMTTLREPVLHILPQTLDVSAFYHQIDILVLPSWRETMPLVVLEAMQAGVCVIQTNRSGMNELIEDGKETFFFSPDDAETLYRLLTQCMNPDFRQTIVQAGQKKVLQLIEHSSFDAQITQLLCA
jgi:glycosyltransferase involved in cell wall biosynthesis